MVKLNLRYVISRPFGWLKTAQFASLLITAFLYDGRHYGCVFIIKTVLLAFCFFSYVGHLFNLQKEKRNSFNNGSDNSPVIPFAIIDFYVSLCASLIFAPFTVSYLIEAIDYLSHGYGRTFEYFVYTAFYAISTFICVKLAVVIYKKANSANNGLLHSLILENAEVSELIPGPASYLPQTIVNELGVNKETAAQPNIFIWDSCIRNMVVNVIRTKQNIEIKLNYLEC